jgi:hypothetical protein
VCSVKEPIVEGKTLDKIMDAMRPPFASFILCMLKLRLYMALTTVLVMTFVNPSAMFPFFRAHLKEYLH